MTGPYPPPPQPTRERVLDAAELLFAQHGYAGTSVRAITHEAGCNVAAVNYHFGGKQGLYREMFMRRLASLRERRVASLRRAVAEGAAGVTLERVLRTFADTFLEPLADESGGRLLVVLFGRELLDPQLEPEVFHREMFVPVRRELVDALAMAAGGPPRGALELCAESFIAQLSHVLHLKRFFDSVPESHAHQLPELVDHIVRFTAAGIRGLAPRGGLTP